jgi:hypothetical protein
MRYNVLRRDTLMKKTIKFDRLTKDFRAMVDNVLIGFYATSAEAQTACDAYVYETLRRTA